MTSLRRQEPLGPGLKRIACEATESAIRALTRQPGQAREAIASIHAAQAMLALLEPDLPNATARRDRAILDRLIDGLTEMTRPCLLLEQLDSRYKKAPDDSDLAQAVKALRKRWSSMSKPDMAMSSRAGNFNPAIYRLVADMAELRGHAGAWPVEDLPDDAPPRGLRRTYHKARRRAAQPTTADSLGELIHATTLLNHQLDVLSKTAPPMLKAQRKLITRAIDGYTQLHLESLLDHAIHQQLGKRETPATDDIRERSDAPAAALTQALAETPAAMTNRLNVYWSVWRRESE